MSYLPFGPVYNSSESAAAKLSQTMRLELAPFHVKVVMLYAGGLQSHIWDNMASSKVNELKDDSLYRPINEEAANIMSGAFIKIAPVEPWAVVVVANITRKTPPIEIWTEALAGTLWWMNFLAPKWSLDMAFNYQTGRGKLRERLNQ